MNKSQLQAKGKLDSIKNLNSKNSIPQSKDAPPKSYTGFPSQLGRIEFYEYQLSDITRTHHDKVIKETKKDKLAKCLKILNFYQNLHRNVSKFSKSIFCIISLEIKICFSECK